MPYFPNTEADRQAMLEAIGAASIDELFAMIPAELRMKRGLCVPPGLGELELTAHLAELAAQNTPAGQAACFLGGGSYDHFIPAVVDMVAGRSEFYTAYTPYQAEASQGSLQAFFEYQTLVTQLTGMDVSQRQPVRRRQRRGRGRADGHARHRPQPRRHRRKRPSRVSPGFGHVSGQHGRRSGRRSTRPTERFPPPNWPPRSTRRRPAFWCSIPTSSAAWKRSSKLAEIAHQAGALFVVSVDPISLGLLKRPGDYGADIVVAEGQSLGNPMAFGGPYLGIMACREQFVRRMPGRLVGQTVDRRGHRCWVLTLQTREQHIRREKATSNICTNQGLYALRATVYLVADGPDRHAGRGRVYVCKRPATPPSGWRPSPSLSLAFDRPTFKEFVVRVKGRPVDALIEKALAREHFRRRAVGPLVSRVGRLPVGGRDGETNEGGDRPVGERACRVARCEMRIQRRRDTVADMKNNPLPRLDASPEMREALLPFCRLKAGEIWEDSRAGHRVGCLDASSRIKSSISWTARRRRWQFTIRRTTWLPSMNVPCRQFIDWCAAMGTRTPSESSGPIHRCTCGLGLTRTTGFSRCPTS